MLAESTVYMLQAIRRRGKQCQLRWGQPRCPCGAAAAAASTGEGARDPMDESAGRRGRGAEGTASAVLQQVEGFKECMPARARQRLPATRRLIPLAPVQCKLPSPCSESAPQLLIFIAVHSKAVVARRVAAALGQLPRLRQGQGQGQAAGESVGRRVDAPASPTCAAGATPPCCTCSARGSPPASASSIQLACSMAASTSASLCGRMRFMASTCRRREGGRLQMEAEEARGAWGSEHWVARHRAAE